MSASVAHFSISGEFITEHSRNLWMERKFKKALDVLGCLIGSTRDQHEAILFGRSKLTGINDLSLEEDNWTTPDGYCASIEMALQQGEHYAELLRRREDDAWDWARENWMETRGSSRERLRFFAYIESLVGKDKAEEIADAVMHEKATKGEDYFEEASAPKSARINPIDLAMHSLKQRMENAGLDSSAMASTEAVMNRGYGKAPQIDDKMQSINGWLLPDGRYYACGGMEHVGTAAELMRGKITDSQDPEKIAEGLGWIKLVKSVTGFHCLWQKKPTKKQLTKLFDYAQKHGRDYEEMILTFDRFLKP